MQFATYKKAIAIYYVIVLLDAIYTAVKIGR